MKEAETQLVASTPATRAEFRLSEHRHGGLLGNHDLTDTYTAEPVPQHLPTVASSFAKMPSAPQGRSPGRKTPLPTLETLLRAPWPPACVLPEVIVGMMEQSTTRRPCNPCLKSAWISSCLQREVCRLWLLSSDGAHI